MFYHHPIKLIITVSFFFSAYYLNHLLGFRITYSHILLGGVESGIITRAHELHTNRNKNSKPSSTISLFVLWSLFDLSKMLKSEAKGEKSFTEEHERAVQDVRHDEVNTVLGKRISGEGNTEYLCEFSPSTAGGGENQPSENALERSVWVRARDYA